MKQFFRTIRIILLGMFSIKYILFVTTITTCMYIYLFIYTDFSIPEFGGGDILLNVFSPFYDNGYSFQKILAYLLPILVSMMIVGRYFQDELDYRCRYSIPRIGNIYFWYNENVFSLIILSILITIWVYLVHLSVVEMTGIGNSILKYSYFKTILDYKTNYPGYLTILYLSTYSTRILIALLLQFLFFLGFQKSQISFAIPLALIILNIYIPVIWMYIPFGSSNISRMINEGRDLGLAYIIMISTCILIYLAGLMTARSRSFLIRGIAIK